MVRCDNGPILRVLLLQILVWLSCFIFSSVEAFCGSETTSRPLFPSRLHSPPALYMVEDDDYDEDSSDSFSSESFAMDPTSEIARTILRDTLQLSSEQHQQLAKLAVLVNDWNSRVNLVSRKDCSRDVVFGRHILPSLAPLPLLSPSSSLLDDAEDPSLRPFAPGQRVCDVGTGGGFPGLPLAIALPELEFLLVDSRGKKLAAVQDMADQLGLKNVKTFHGRAESIPEARKFDWVTGRSVAAIKTFAFWIDHLLKDGKSSKGSDGEDRSVGHLIYLNRRDVEDELLELVSRDEDIADLLGCSEISDKRVLVFSQSAVHSLALASGEKLRVPRRGGGTTARSHRKSNKSRPRKSSARGEWQKRDSSAPKQRGYEGFRRFDSLQEN